MSSEDRWYFLLELITLLSWYCITPRKNMEFAQCLDTYLSTNPLITVAPSLFNANINNWSHSSLCYIQNKISVLAFLELWEVVDKFVYRIWRLVLYHKRGPVIRHSVRWLGASANIYLVEIHVDIKPLDWKYIAGDGYKKERRYN